MKLTLMKMPARVINGMYVHVRSGVSNKFPNYLLLSYLGTLERSQFSFRPIGSHNNNIINFVNSFTVLWIISLSVSKILQLIDQYTHKLILEFQFQACLRKSFYHFLT